VVGGFHPHSGTFAAELSNGSLSQAVATPGASYTIKFFVALVEGTFDSFSVTWGGVTLLTLTNQQGFDYTEFTFNVTASTASTALEFTFAAPRSAWLLDDVSVNPAGVPDVGSTLPLLGFALLGLAALRRKLSC
jgi:VPDSG-CTERM motif